MSYLINTLSSNCTAIVIESNSRDNLLEISPEFLLTNLKKFGVVLFRGFDVTLPIFSTFIKTNSKKITYDPARQTFFDYAQKVDAGFDEVGLHLENGNAPVLPHCIWFFCNVAASEGSKTTVCDGATVWQNLSAPTKNIFLEKKIMYRRRVEEEMWKKYVASELGGDITFDEVTTNHLEELCESVEGQSVILNHDGSIISTYCVSAVNKPLFMDGLAFSNSILGPSYNYEEPEITFDDGSQISTDIWNEVKAVTEDAIVEIDWKDKDVVVIDNTRFMHGRRKILDARRELYAGLSYIV